MNANENVKVIGNDQNQKSTIQQKRTYIDPQERNQIVTPDQFFTNILHNNDPLNLPCK